MAVFDYRHYELAAGTMGLTRRYFRAVNEPDTARHRFTLMGPWEVVAGTTITLHYLLLWTGAHVQFWKPMHEPTPPPSVGGS